MCPSVFRYQSALWVLRRRDKSSRSGRPSSSTMSCLRVHESTSSCGWPMPAASAPGPQETPKDWLWWGPRARGGAPDTRGRRPPIANPQALVLSAPRPALEIGDLDGAVRRVLEAIDHQRLAALDLQASLQGGKDKKRHDIVAREGKTTVEFVNELMRRQSSLRPREIKVPVRGLVGAEEAVFLDNGIDGGFHPRQNRIGDQ